MQAIRILLVDDHTLLRDALSQQLSEFVEFEVVGSASDAGEAMVLAFELKPDVIVMDIDMPGMICFDAVERIRARLEQVAVLFVIEIDDQLYQATVPAKFIRIFASLPPVKVTNSGAGEDGGASWLEVCGAMMSFFGQWLNFGIIAGMTAAVLKQQC